MIQRTLDITLLSVVGKLYCKILSNRLVVKLESEGAIHLALGLVGVALIIFLH